MILPNLFLVYVSIYGEVINVDNKKRMGIIILVILTIGVVIWQWRRSFNDTNFPEMTSETRLTAVEAKESRQSTTSPHTKIYVDIKGAVHRPGMYELTEDARLSDAIQAAKGLTKEADDNRINLAQKVNDQECIHIPKKGEKVDELVETPQSSSKSSTSIPITSGEKGQNSQDNHDKININQADAQQFQTIDGIGEKRAKMIIQYRQEHGSFKQIEDLKKITGIGDKTFEKLKDKVSV